MACCDAPGFHPLGRTAVRVSPFPCPTPFNSMLSTGSYVTCSRACFSSLISSDDFFFWRDRRRVSRVEAKVRRTDLNLVSNDSPMQRRRSARFIATTTKEIKEKGELIITFGHGRSTVHRGRFSSRCMHEQLHFSTTSAKVKFVSVCP
jgi:hypothetical protein